MIEAIGITKFYGEHLAVQNVSFSVDKGEVVGFLGPNGAGKTTTMRILTGYLPATDGCAKIGGYDISESPRKAKELIGYLPEHPPLYDDLTVREYLKFVARLKGVSRKETKTAIDNVASSCGLEPVIGRLIGNISKGFRQRVGIAQALLKNPPILILDEPTIGLDPKQIVEIRSLIKELGKERTIILSTHILAEVAMTCEKAVIIHKGNIVAKDSIDNLTRKGEAEQIRLDVRGAVSQEEVLRELKSIQGVSEARADDGGFEVFIEPKSNAREKLASAIVGRGWTLREMRSLAKTLEEIFLQLTKEESGR